MATEATASRDYTCIPCSKPYDNYHALYMHKKRHHANNGQAEATTVTSQSHVVCGICSQNLGTMKGLIFHLQSNHGLPLNIETAQFSSESEFEQWKLQAERSGQFKFKKVRTASAKSKSNKWLCNRSGCYDSKSAGLRAPKHQGSIKSGFTCSTFLAATTDSFGCVTIEFCTDHYGHDNKLGRLRLDNDIRGQVAKQIMDGFTVNADDDLCWPFCSKPKMKYLENGDADFSIESPKKEPQLASPSKHTTKPVVAMPTVASNGESSITTTHISTQNGRYIVRIHPKQQQRPSINTLAAKEGASSAPANCSLSPLLMIQKFNHSAPCSANGPKIVQSESTVSDAIAESNQSALEKSSVAAYKSSLICRCCGECFDHPVNRRCHEIAKHASNTCAICGEAYFISSEHSCPVEPPAKTDTNTEAVEPFQCSTCGMPCRSFAVLTRHNEVVHGAPWTEPPRQRRYACRFCPRHFATAAMRQGHVTSDHFICELCAKPCLTLAALNAHVDKDHALELLAALSTKKRAPEGATKGGSDVEKADATILVNPDGRKSNETTSGRKLSAVAPKQVCTKSSMASTAASQSPRAPVKAAALPGINPNSSLIARVDHESFPRNEQGGASDHGPLANGTLPSGVRVAKTASVGISFPCSGCKRRYCFERLRDMHQRDCKMAKQVRSIAAIGVDSSSDVDEKTKIEQQDPIAAQVEEHPSKIAEVKSKPDGAMEFDSALAKHIKIEPPDIDEYETEDVSGVVCENCGEMFPNSASKTLHMESGSCMSVSAHRLSVDTASVEPAIASVVSSSANFSSRFMPKTWFCATCHEVFATRQALRSHRRTASHSGYRRKTRGDGGVMPSASSEPTDVPTAEKKLPGNLMTKLMASNVAPSPPTAVAMAEKKRSLKFNTKLWPCKRCGELFAGRRAMRLHRKTAHNGSDRKLAQGETEVVSNEPPPKITKTDEASRVFVLSPKNLVSSSSGANAGGTASTKDLKLSSDRLPSIKAWQMPQALSVAPGNSTATRIQPHARNIGQAIRIKPAVSQIGPKCANGRMRSIVANGYQRGSLQMQRSVALVKKALQQPVGPADPYACPHCGETFETATNKAAHILVEHKLPSDPNDDSNYAIADFLKSKISNNNLQQQLVTNGWLKQQDMLGQAAQLYIQSLPSLQKVSRD